MVCRDVIDDGDGGDRGDSNDDADVGCDGDGEVT